jgi:hypothetical protein
VPIRTESDFHLTRKIFIQGTDEICSDYANELEVIWHQMKNKFQVKKPK